MVKLFGEDPKSMQPEEFYGIFDSFLLSFSDAREENEKFKRQKEEEEKRAAMEAQVEIWQH